VTAQVKGVLRVIAKPLVGRIPIVAGVALCFLEQPVSGVCFLLKQFYRAYTKHVSVVSDGIESTPLMMRTLASYLIIIIIILIIYLP